MSIQSKEDVKRRIQNFWETEILQFCETEAVVLVVTHGRVLACFKEYWQSQNYQVHESGKNGSWNGGAKNCSIYDIVILPDGTGQIVRAGDCSHLINVHGVEILNSMYENL